ncbi:MAG: hypothetical protein ACYDEI_00190 [Erysipelotrichaceae bacterium]
MIRFIIKYLRPIYAVPIGFIYDLYYMAKGAYNNSVYNYNMNYWYNIETLDQLINYFFNKFVYVYDGYKGLVDHKNYELEFFSCGGDCDDMAFYVQKKLTKLGYYAKVYFIYGNGINNCHFDCLFKSEDGLFFFNYGNLIDINHTNKVGSKIDVANKKKYAKIYGWDNPCKWVEL